MTSSDLSHRYGKTTSRRPVPLKLWYGLTALAVLCGLALVVWIQSADSGKPVGRDVGFELTSADEVQITFEVSKRAEDTAVCAVKALDTAGAPVGWKEVAIGPYANENGHGISVQTVHLRVLAEATTVTIDSCWKAN